MSTEDQPRHLRIVRGDPTPEEIAALVAVLAAAVPRTVEEGPARPAPASQWAPPSRLVRGPIGPTGWWPSALPR